MQVSYVMSSLQQGGRGTQACLTAQTQIQGIIGDLDTTLMFISSGALETDGGTFADHRYDLHALIYDVIATVVT